MRAAPASTASQAPGTRPPLPAAPPAPHPLPPRGLAPAASAAASCSPRVLQPPHCHPVQPRRHAARATAGVAATAAAVAVAALVAPEASHALQAEPANALSLPTWAIHVSSVVEWAVAMSLMWRYGDVSGNPRWKGLAWAMLPCFGSAMCACTWHFFYNSPELEYLVALQAFLTLVGNTACAYAGFRIWKAAKSEAQA